MGAVAYVALASVDPGLIALLVALATGGPTLIFAIYKWRRTAPEERDDLITRAATQAVEAMDRTLKAAADERQALIEKCNRCEVRIASLEERVDQLERGWPSGHPLPSPS